MHHPGSRPVKGDARCAAQAGQHSERRPCSARRPPRRTLPSPSPLIEQGAAVLQQHHHHAMAGVCAIGGDQRRDGVRSARHAVRAGLRVCQGVWEWREGGWGARGPAADRAPRRPHRSPRCWAGGLQRAPACGRAHDFVTHAQHKPLALVVVGYNQSAGKAAARAAEGGGRVGHGCARKGGLEGGLSGTAVWGTVAHAKGGWKGGLVYGSASDSCRASKRVGWRGEGLPRVVAMRSRPHAAASRGELWLARVHLVVDARVANLDLEEALLPCSQRAGEGGGGEVSGPLRPLVSPRAPACAPRPPQRSPHEVFHTLAHSQ